MDPYIESINSNISHLLRNSKSIYQPINLRPMSKVMAQKQLDLNYKVSYTQHFNKEHKKCYMQLIFLRLSILQQFIVFIHQYCQHQTMKLNFL